MDILRVSSVQSDIVWENVEENLHRRQRDIESLSGKTDLVILPEMFTTGFTMHVGQYDHTITEYTIETIRNWSDRYRIAEDSSSPPTGLPNIMTKNIFSEWEEKVSFLQREMKG